MINHFFIMSLILGVHQFSFDYRNSETYGAFQSKDPILAMEKGGDTIKGGSSNEHGIFVHHPTS